MVFLLRGADKLFITTGNVKKARKKKKEKTERVKRWIYFDVLTLLGGLSLFFLFGMNLMGASLEKRAGSSLKILLGELTSRKNIGILDGEWVSRR